MKGSDELTLLAELSVGFAGFVAIFMLFARRGGTFLPADSVRITATIWASFGTLFISLVPLLLALTERTETEVWKLSSWIFLVFIAVVDLFVFRMQSAIPDEEKAKIGAANNYVAWGLSAVMFGLLVSNIAGIPSPASSFPYVTSAVCVLAIAVSNFLAIVSQKLNHDETAA